MAQMDDWRRQGQEHYLTGVPLIWKKYTKYREDWDHDHCEFCYAKFMESDNADVLTEGYVTADEYRWICQQCFEDFQSEYNWQVVNEIG